MTTLDGPLLRLRPLQLADADALVTAAADGELWNLPFTVVPSANTIQAYISRALQGQAEGTVMPFAVELRSTGQLIGSTRFWKMDRENRQLEIGHTWYSATWQRTRANTEAKWLMLEHAFEGLHCIRVQLTTDVLNERSRRAILRLGATEEGIIRNERIMPDGRKRTSVRYSIIDDEWPLLRIRLLARLSGQN